MRHVETNFVPDIGVSVAGGLVIASLLAFLVFLDRYLHRLRPVAVSALVHKYFRRNFTYEVHRAANPDVFIGVLDVGARLDATVAQSFGDSVDLARASVADTQGIGGPRTRPVDHTPV
jgi:hypothetical protein